MLDDQYLRWDERREALQVVCLTCEGEGSYEDEEWDRGEYRTFRQVCRSCDGTGRVDPDDE